MSERATTGENSFAAPQSLSDMTNCSHKWRYVGMTTICQPEIAHYACPECRTFRQVVLWERYKDYDISLGLEPQPNKATDHTTWTQGPWPESTWKEIESDPIAHPPEPAP